MAILRGRGEGEKGKDLEGKERGGRAPTRERLATTVPREEGKGEGGWKERRGEERKKKTLGPPNSSHRRPHSLQLGV